MQVVSKFTNISGRVCGEGRLGAGDSLFLMFTAQRGSEKQNAGEDASEWQG